MARRSRSTFMKRQKELSRQQRKKEKQARRFDKKNQEGPEPAPTGVDPDIAGIRPGPQPLPVEFQEFLQSGVPRPRSAPPASEEGGEKEASEETGEP